MFESERGHSMCCNSTFGRVAEETGGCTYPQDA